MKPAKDLQIDPIAFSHVPTHTVQYTRTHSLSLTCITARKATRECSNGGAGSLQERVRLCASN